MADQYTHTFKFEVEGAFARGECEFNTDGEASFKFDELSQPIPRKVMKWFGELMSFVKKMHDEKIGEDLELKKIIIREKTE